MVRDYQYGRCQGGVRESGWEERKSTNMQVLTLSESIQQMRVREEIEALYMAIVADQGAGKWWGGKI